MPTTKYICGSQHRLLALETRGHNSNKGSAEIQMRAI